MNPIDAERWKTRAGLAHCFANGEVDIVRRRVNMLPLHRYLKYAGIDVEKSGATESLHKRFGKVVAQVEEKVRGSCFVGTEAAGAIFKRCAVGLD